MKSNYSMTAALLLFIPTGYVPALDERMVLEGPFPTYAERWGTSSASHLDSCSQKALMQLVHPYPSGNRWKESLWFQKGFSKRWLITNNLIREITIRSLSKSNYSNPFDIVSSMAVPMVTTILQRRLFRTRSITCATKNSLLQ